MVGKSNWQLFQVEVVNNGPDRHRCQHSKNGAEMEWYEADNTEQKHGMGQGFHRLKSEGSPGRRPPRSVVPLVGPAVKDRAMKKAMGDIKVAILQNEYQDITASYVPPAMVSNLIIDPSPAKYVKLYGRCHCHRKDGCRNNRC